MSRTTRIPVAVLGATGAVGQRFVALLADHPWFEIAVLTGSGRTEGKSYGESVRWILDVERPARYDAVRLSGSDRPGEVAIAFSALPADAAATVEPLWAQAGSIVCSNASAFRMEDDVPLLVPEINPAALDLLGPQRRGRGWPGAIVTNPNCATAGVVMALKPLLDAFGLEKAFVTTLQAASGAGYPGVPSLDLIDNVIPFIDGEEEKIESEPRKILGPLAISAHCTRVPVVDGHLAMISAGLAATPSLSEVEAALSGFRAPAIVRELPSSPTRPIHLRREPDRPQPRRDRNAGAGMTVAVGRVRHCPLLGVKLAVLSHNTIRGAAGCAILNAELLVAQGFVS